MTKATYKKKGLFGADSSRGIGVHHSHSGEHGSREVGIALGQQLRTHKQKAECTLGMAQAFMKHQLHPQ